MAYYSTILSLTGIYIILALSVYMTFAVGQFSLAQVGFWAIGAYGSAMLTTLWGWPLWLALLAMGCLCGLIGAGLGYPCLRLRGFYLALATLGFSETVRVFFQNLEYKITIKGIPTGPGGILGFRNVAVLTSIYDIFIFLGLLIFGLFWISRSRIYLAIASIREDDIAAQFMGINIVLTKELVFIAAAAVAGIGGGLYANYTSYISADDFGFHLTMVAILFVAVGGTRTFYGPIVAAAALTILPEYFRFLAEYRMIFYGALVIVLMTVRPRGLIDERTIAALRGRFSRAFGTE